MGPTSSSVSCDFLKKNNQTFKEKARRGKPTVVEELGSAVESNPMEVDVERYQEFYEKLFYNYFKEPHEYPSKSLLTQARN